MAMFLSARDIRLQSDFLQRLLFASPEVRKGSIATIHFASLRPFEQLFMLAGVADP